MTARIARYSLALVFFMLLADGAYVAWRVNDSMRSVESKLETGADLIVEGDIEAGRAAMNEAMSDVEAASAALDHPAPKLISWVPPFERDVQAIESLVRASEDIVSAGMIGLQGAESINVGSDGFVGALYSDGQIQLEALSELQPLIPDILARMDHAQTALENAPHPFTGLVTEPLDVARERVARARTLARNAGAFAELAPVLFAEDVSRVYLVLFQGPAEARATGGIIGQFGTMRVRDGELSEFRPSDLELETESPEPVDAPAWYERAYRGFGSLKSRATANLSPHFPTVSEVLLRLYESNTGRRLDGVIGLDSIAFAELLQGMESFEVPGFDRSLTQENARPILLRDAYLDYSKGRQDAFFRAIIEEFWRRLGDGEVNPAGLLSGMSEAVRGRHVQIYLRNDNHEALSQLGMDGDFTDDGLVQFIYHNNYAFNKVDSYTRRALDMEIDIKGDGSATVTTAISVRNDAPDGPRSNLLGPFLKGDPPGLSRMLLGMLMPKDAEDIVLEVAGEEVVPDLHREAGHPVAIRTVYMPSGTGSRLVLRYRIPNAVRNRLFEMTLLPQPAATVDELDLRVAGDDVRLREGSPGNFHDGVLDLSTPLDRTIRLRIEVVD